LVEICNIHLVLIISSPIIMVPFYILKSSYMVKDVEKINLLSKNSIILKIYKILKFFWIRNPWNIYSWLKYHSWRWFIDWFFWKEYIYISNERYTYISIERSIKVKDFYKYFIDKRRYDDLIKWLDFESVELVNKYLSVLNYILWNRDLCVPTELLLFSDNPLNKKIKKNIQEYTKNLYIPGELLPEVRFYKHWIYHIPNILSYTQWKDIIDCWAFIWDSALMFDNELKINKIFSLEPDCKNYKILENVIKKNHRENKIIPINLWAWSKKSELKFESWRLWCSWIKENWDLIINIDKIDNIVKERKINPWLIKRDIEW